MITIKPNKEETKLLNWLNKARSTDPMRDTLSSIQVKNGVTVAVDGMRMHFIPTPDCIKELNLAKDTAIKQVTKSLHADTLAEFDTPPQNYPDIDQVMPRGESKFRIGVNPKFLIDALSGFDGNVILTFYGPTLPFTVTSLDDKESIQKALIMHCYIGD
jgi:hypothetical protein